MLVQQLRFPVQSPIALPWGVDGADWIAAVVDGF
jgi:hypothetical protein